MVPFRIPSLEESLHQFGEALHPKIPHHEFHLLVWNVWKGKRGEQWKKDFRRLSVEKDLILLQEAMLDQHMPVLWKEHFADYQWNLAASFEYNSGVRTGVATGSRIRLNDINLIRGSNRELFIWTPKISLATKHLLSHSEEDHLLVVNTHVVNFTTTNAFTQFIQELVDVIEHHKGPLILAGDFNTWSFRRWLNLNEILARLNVLPVDFNSDPRLLKLDHVFIRGMKVDKAILRHDITSSDHYPIELVFKW